MLSRAVRTQFSPSPQGGIKLQEENFLVRTVDCIYYVHLQSIMRTFKLCFNLCGNEHHQAVKIFKLMLMSVVPLINNFNLIENKLKGKWYCENHDDKNMSMCLKGKQK